MVEKVIQIGKRDVTIYRCGLKVWMELERLSESVYEAARSGNSQATEEAIYSYLLAASTADREFLASRPWFDVALLFAEATKINECHADIPLLKARTKKGTPVPWDYLTREWYSLAHLLAGSYSWTLEYIAELDPDDVFPLVQEILTDEQLQREWQHSLSELS